MYVLAPKVYIIALQGYELLVLSSATQMCTRESIVGQFILKFSGQAVHGSALYTSSRLCCFQTIKDKNNLRLLDSGGLDASAMRLDHRSHTEHMRHRPLCY